MHYWLVAMRCSSCSREQQLRHNESFELAPDRAPTGHGGVASFAAVMTAATRSLAGGVDVIRIELDTEALVRVRLSYSPMWELVCSLKLLIHDPRHRLHAPWVAWASPRVDPELLDLLRGLMPTRYRFPDFLTPHPGARPRSIRAELAMLAATDPAVAQAEVCALYDDSPPKAISAVLHDRADGMTQVAAALERYWKQALGPVWPGLRRVLTADLAYRADELASSGLQALLNRLHPAVRFDGRAICIDKTGYTLRVAGPDGIVLVPCVFAWPHVLMVDAEPYPVTISYAPRGAGAVWQIHRQTKAHPAARLIGHSRAAILALLDLPLSTTQLAEQAKMSLPAVSQHLTVLRRSGLVNSRRAGRTILNTRTELGHALLDTGDDS